MKKFNKIKKSISFILALVMTVMISVPLTALATDTQITDAQEAKKGYDFIKAVGAMAGDEIAFKADTAITRAHFVKLALHIANDAPEVLVSDDEVFADVTPDTAYENYIETAYRIGYISGNPGGAFRPDDTILLPEALKILCGILGYDRLAEGLGGYPEGYVVVANRLDLLNGVEIADNNELDMASAMVLLRNALDADLMQYVSYGDDIKTTVVEGVTLLYKRHNIRRTEGVINATAYTHLYAQESGLEKGQIMIEDKVLDDFTETAYELLGQYVDAYYKVGADIITPQLVYALPRSSSNNIITVDVKDIGFDGTNLYYEDGDYTTDIRLSTSATYILNRKMAAMTPEELVGITKGEVSFISNDGDAAADVVLITKYDTHIATGVDKTNGIITTKDGSKLEIDVNDEDYTIYLEKDGTACKIEDLKGGDCLLVCRSTGAGIGHITILASSESVTGVLEKIMDDIVVIDGEEYELGVALQSGVTVGATYKALLDALGEIAYVEVENDIVYGYLYDIAAAKVFSNPKVKIFTENDRWVELYLADTIEYNGEDTPAAELYQTLFDMGSGYMQMIRYRVNKDAEVVKIETAQEILIGSDGEAEAAKNDTFRKSYEASANYRTALRTFDGRIFLESNAKVFTIPADLDEEKFKVSTPNAFVANKSYAYVAYDVDETLQCSVITVPSTVNNSLNNTDSFMMVDSIGEMLTNDGKKATALFGHRKGKVIGFPVEVGDDGVSQETINALQKGDFVHVRFNDKGMVSYMAVYPIGTDYYVSGTIYEQCTIIVGKVTRIDSDVSRLRVKYNEGGAELGMAYTQTMTIYIWDRAEQRLIKATASDIQPGDRVLANCNYLVANEIMVVRN